MENCGVCGSYIQEKRTLLVKHYLVNRIIHEMVSLIRI